MCSTSSGYCFTIQDLYVQLFELLHFVICPVPVIPCTCTYMYLTVDYNCIYSALGLQTKLLLSPN